MSTRIKGNTLHLKRNNSVSKIDPSSISSFDEVERTLLEKADAGNLHFLFERDIQLVWGNETIKRK